jgi:proteasome lid subunit RPN8/RPN11
MLTQARAELPNECCGLLAGRLDPVAVRHVQACYPLVNALARPTAYLSEPRSMFAAMRDMRELGIDVLAIYHSHPSSDPIPSRTDRD